MRRVLQRCDRDVKGVLQRMLGASGENNNANLRYIMLFCYVMRVIGIMVSRISRLSKGCWVSRFSKGRRGNEISRVGRVGMVRGVSRVGRIVGLVGSLRLVGLAG
jgi:hypothetical protein